MSEQEHDYGWRSRLTEGGETLRRACWKMMLADVGTRGDLRLDSMGRPIQWGGRNSKEKQMGMIFEEGVTIKDRRADSLPRGPTHARKFNAYSDSRRI